MDIDSLNLLSFSDLQRKEIEMNNIVLNANTIQIFIDGDQVVM